MDKTPSQRSKTINLVLPLDLYMRVDDYRYTRRVGSLSATVRLLLEKALANEGLSPSPGSQQKRRT